MGRQSTVDDAVMFASVGQALAETGTMSIQDIVSGTGVSIGSIYNRYGSREGLLAEAWLDAVGAFQGQFLSALQGSTVEAGENAALVTPKFSRNMPARAIILAVCRRSEFLTDKTQDDLREQIETINKPAFKAIADFAKYNEKPLDMAQLALIAIPLGAVRLYLPDRRVPKSIDRYIRAAYRAVMCED